MYEPMVVGRLAGMLGELAGVPSAVADDAVRIDVIAGLEKLKAAAAAAPLRVIADFAASQEAANKARGVEARQASRGVAEQVGLARRVSPASAARQVAQANALMGQLPETFALLRRGEISEHVATIVTIETSHLAAEDRRLVDKQLAGQLPRLSPRRAEAATRRLAIEVDPAGAVARASQARADRRVSIRPAPDTMTMLSALLPCEQGVAAWAALRRTADSLTATGDGRGRGQIMADTLVERLTGQASAGAVSAEIGLVMTDTSLFTGDETAAELTGYGPIPAAVARHIARGTPDRAGHSAIGPVRGMAAELDHRLRRVAPPSQPAAAAASGELRRARLFLRRLFTDPATGIITDCDPRRRRFNGTLATLLVYRDGGTCRDPYCDAPIRHLDHIQTHATGGPTTATNGCGKCARGNYDRHMPGFTIRLIDPARHIIETTTPTGHT
ncbi:MAG TPA: DUF222 domain-containing protein [Jiangellaceae bacterium]|nr:DUF222 domain-containing protein [Jiangellaceae bacterium]